MPVSIPTPAQLTAFQVRGQPNNPAAQAPAPVQATYDLVNRMVRLIGDVTFEDLFQQEWGDRDGELGLMQRLIANLTRVSYSVPVANAITGYLNLLKTNFPTKKFETFGTVPIPGLEDPARDALEVLGQLGIYLPFPGDDMDQKNALTNLLALPEARKLTYYHVHNMGPADFKAATGLSDADVENVRKAVEEAMMTGLLPSR